MEPLELGPNAGSDARGPPLPDTVVQQESDDVYEVGDPPRLSAQDISAGSGRAESHGSTEVWAFVAIGVLRHPSSLQACVAPHQGALTVIFSAIFGDARRTTLHSNTISVATSMFVWGTRLGLTILPS